MKNIILSVLSFLVFMPFLSAQKCDDYHLTFSGECLFLSGGVSLNLIGALLNNRMQPPDPGELRRERIPWFDRFSMNCDNHFTEKVSDATLLMCMGLPVLASLQANSGPERRENLLLVVESSLLINGITHITKALVRRARPYAYHKKNPALNANAARSFFSGHTSLAFNSAVAAGLLIQSCHTQSKWRHHFWSAGLSLASLTGIFRITSGNHFLSDVVAGALAGSFTAFITMALH